MSKKDRVIKTKITEFIANEARHRMIEALNEVTTLKKYPQFIDTSSGPGLDLMVLKDKLESALDYIELLR